MQQNTMMSLRNHTGLQMSPRHAQQMLDAQRDFRPATTDPGAADALRTDYYAEAEPLGTIPAPGTARGMAKAGMQVLSGKRPQLLIDKLGERLAFERAGTRLYDAMIRKCTSTMQVQTPAFSAPIDELRRIRDEEARHADLLVQAIEMLGGDPTAQTPGAALVGVEGMGLMQVINDPRTSPTQSLHALLTAELSDDAGWELLIEVAEHCQQTELAHRFQAARSEELRHADDVRRWHTQAVLSDATLGRTAH